MSYIVIYERETGKVLQCVDIPSEYHENAARDNAFIEIDSDTFKEATTHLGYVLHGNWCRVPDSPSAAHEYDYTTHVWVDKRTLEEVKDTKWEAIKLERSQIEFGGFEFEGNIYDSDQVSQGRIMGAAAAGIDQVWTLRDNTTVNLTASQLQQLYAALQAHIASVHERGRIARQLIFDAETKEQVEAVQL
ncbi:DUF4376 domain-containing protein [Acinetobacter junii]|uniref:DUF4376 domain-containing protein n=1 Tax=Acinetobacter junii TaxID=40215 RepID=UPI0032B3F5E0